MPCLLENNIFYIVFPPALYKHSHSFNENNEAEVKPNGKNIKHKITNFSIYFLRKTRIYLIFRFNTNVEVALLDIKLAHKTLN